VLGVDRLLIRSRWGRFAVPFVAVAAAAGVRAIMLPELRDRLPFVTFFPAVVLTAVMGGVWPAVIALGLSAAWFAVLMSKHQPEGLVWGRDGISELAFLFNGGLVVLVCEMLRRSTVAAKRAVARQRELVREQAAAAEAVRRSEAEYRVLFESAGVGKAEVDADSKRFVRVNRKMCEMTGYAAEELLAMRINELTHPDDRAADVERYARLLGGEVQEYDVEKRYVRKDGSAIWVSVNVTANRDGSGKAVRLVGVAQDIMERKRIETEREELLAREQSARAEAERAGRMKDEFLATLSHELRTPLNAILGWSQVLRGRGAGSAEELGEGLAVIERNARVQTQLIEDLLDMSRIITGKLRLDVRRVDLTAVIESAVASVKLSAEAKGIRIHTVLDPLAGPVKGDPARLQQVVWNLLANAIKFTPKGGRVEVTLERVNSHVEMALSDTGIGIKPEFLPHLFERFRQADASTTRRFGGLGLGLAIVKHLVEQHGGSVVAKSAGEGQGATFRVTLPLPVAREGEEIGREHPAVEAERQMALDEPQPDLSGVRVLVVDDEADARDLIRRVLEDLGAEIRTAGSAGEAMEWFADGRQDIPAVLISDVGMPDVDGFELMRRVRATGPQRGGKVPAVALTAFARSEDRRRAMMAGFDMFVSKPVEPAELAAVVARLAGRAGG
jgi:PAS domain S-box-containing protein